ncbi:MAG: sensory box histidine kinase/response regulator [Myxococcales bacterium]|nr:sensory box histidine kinase/response regulator [Myxococcales bacterium]
MTSRERELKRQLLEAQSMVAALLSGQIDAVVDLKSKTPMLLSKAQSALCASEERYRRIVETTNEGIWTVDLESNITFVNERLAQILGYSLESMLGRPSSTFLPEAFGPAAALRVERLRAGLSEEREVQCARSDGAELWVQIKTSPIRDADGNNVGALTMVTDRTSHMRAESALRKSEEQYRQIVEATSDGIIKIDAEGRIVFVNSRFAEMIGYETRALVGASAYDFMSAAAKESAGQQSQQRTKDAIDTTLRHKDGSEISVNIAVSYLVDGATQAVGYLGLVRDVTERKKLTSQLMVSDRMASVGTLAAGVAHEINNPLAAVIANLDFVSESLTRMRCGDGDLASRARRDVGLYEEIKAPLDEAREAAERVRLIVRDLKIFSRSPTDEARGVVDVKAIMESSLRMGWNEIRHRARLVKHYGVVPAVDANEGRLGQVFLNLLVNAAQALPEGRAEHNEIHVSTRLEGERVIVEVRDTGPGIAPEIIGRVFDAFFTTKAVGVGTGLGLAICHRIVADVGGELTVASELGKGATFRVSLPIGRKEETMPLQPPTTVAPASRRGRVLIVDDEVLLLQIVKRVLSKEHDVVALASAKEALALCAGGDTFDLILCDLMMPEMTGMDFHHELSLVAPDQANRMIFLTGGAFTAKARHFLSDTPREHLEKPFDPANLRAIVQRYLR